MTAFLARHAFPAAIGAIAAAFLGLFFLYPVLNVFGASVLDSAGTAFTLRNYAGVLSNPFFLQALSNSLIVAAAATALAIVFGVPFAFCVARLPIAGTSVLLALAALPLVLPSFVSAYALVLMLGRAGIVTGPLRAAGLPFESIYGLKGIVTAFTLTLYPYVVLPAVAAFKSIDASVEEAAQNLGAPRGRTLRTVLLPLALPSILAGGLLVFIEALENFGVPFVLAEDKPILAVEAFKLFVGETADNPAAAGVLGVLLIACTVAALFVQRAMLSRRRYATMARRPAPLLTVSPPVRRLGTLYCWALVGAALVPFAAVVVISLLAFKGPVLQYAFSLGNFAELFRRSYRPLVNTLALAAAAAAAATLIGVPIGYVIVRRRSRLSALLDVLATAPFAVAGTVLGIGLILAFGHGFLILTGTAAIMIIAYVVRKLPFSVRAASAILHQIDPSLEEASINLGVAPLPTFLRVTVPLMLGGIAGGSVLVFVTVASELSSTVVLYSGRWTTMTVAMFQALEGTSAGVAAAAATVLILVTILPVALVYRLLRRYEPVDALRNRNPTMIDLRSDTVTLPTEEMREAMRRADLGDDSRDGDPTVRRLEEKAAAMTGKEAAMLVASGTMSNLVCLLAHAQQGGEVLLDPESHILRSEMGGIARLAGLFHRTVPADRGSLDVAALRETLSARLTPARLATALVCVETTHNSAGGAVIPLACLAKVRAAAAEQGVPVHIDGARLFNAAVALGVPAAEIARHSDSVGFCLSKGLSAPVGSVVCGSAAFIARARAFRRMLGGAMRQAGVIAAAGIVALDSMVARLADDHRRARRIAQGLHALDPRLVDPRTVETNIVMVDLASSGADAAAWVPALAARGLRASTWARTQLRLVIHRHITDADVDGAVDAFRSAHAEFAPALVRAQ